MTGRRPRRRLAAARSARRVVAARSARRVVAGLLTGLLIVAATAGVGAALTGTRVVVVASDSMRPALRTGDALLVPSSGPAEVGVGDVVVYRAASGRGWVVHRVVETRTVSGQRYLVTQGDANANPDPDLLPVDNVHGTAYWRVPWLGHGLRWFSTATVRLVIGVVIAAVFMQELVILTRTCRRLRARSRQVSCARPDRPG